MNYLTSEVKDALHAEGLQFCQENSIKYGTFDGQEIVKADDIRESLGRTRLDPSKYYFIYEVPHFVWSLQN